MSEVKFEPFQRVLVRNDDIAYWGIDFFEEYAETLEYPYVCLTNSYKQCLPYNDETKHLLGTDNSPTPPEPEFRWGDHVEAKLADGYVWEKAIYCFKEKGKFVCLYPDSHLINASYCRHADW